MPATIQEAGFSQLSIQCRPFRLEWDGAVYGEAVGEAVSVGFGDGVAVGASDGLGPPDGG